MPPFPEPNRAVIRSYQVGFGDCFLLSFHYPTFERHILIDFGTTARPPGSTDSHMKKIAEDIKRATSGKLHAVVATHRHRDHISGFAGKSGEIIAELEPNVVIQPWTEDPDAAVDALEATRVEKKGLSIKHTLANMDSVVRQARRVASSLRPHLPELSDRLDFIGEDNVKNKAAVKALQEIGRADKHGNRRNRYLREGNSAGLTSLLPGVRVHVLGPPSLEQTTAIREQTDENDEEFWQMQALAGDLALDEDQQIFPRASLARDPIYARPFRARMREVRLEQMLELVLELDDALNNTSLILLFETHGRRFLFPGDAQWENWQHALSNAEYREMLEGVDLYKVGHHGSRNATPRSLWRLFDKRSTQTADADRLTSVMSTLAGKHGHEESKTEVPRTTLVAELESKSRLFDTRDVTVDELCHRIEYSFD